jgi:hypothetical protein
MKKFGKKKKRGGKKNQEREEVEEEEEEGDNKFFDLMYAVAQNITQCVENISRENFGTTVNDLRNVCR